MCNRQALGIDINEWSRIGRIDYDLVIKHLQDGVYDFLIIKASYRDFKSLLFNEQKQEAEKLGIPYTTYHFLVLAKGRDEFMQLLFGGKSVLSTREEGNGASGVKVQPNEPTYAGMTNQAMINLIFKAARSFTTDPWKDWIVRAGLEFLAIPD